MHQHWDKFRLKRPRIVLLPCYGSFRSCKTASEHHLTQIIAFLMQISFRNFMLEWCAQTRTSTIRILFSLSFSQGLRARPSFCSFSLSSFWFSFSLPSCHRPVPGERSRWRACLFQSLPQSHLSVKNKDTDMSKLLMWSNHKESKNRLRTGLSRVSKWWRKSFFMVYLSQIQVDT